MDPEPPSDPDMAAELLVEEALELFKKRLAQNFPDFVQNS